MVIKNLKVPKSLPQIGWREWITLPDFEEVRVKAKIDTGAKTSAIHARNIREEEVGDRLFVTFDLQPRQRAKVPSLTCRAAVTDHRVIRNSGGQEETRYVIRTPAAVGLYEFDIELTLTRRDNMGFRMLLGRDAVKNLFLVNPARSFLHGNTS